MKVLLNGSLYGMNRKQLRACLKVASKAVPCGIYAIEKDGLCEMRRDTFDDLEEMLKEVREYEEKGFKVHCNPKMELLKCKNIGEKSGMVECAEFPEEVVRNYGSQDTISIVEK